MPNTDMLAIEICDRSTEPRILVMGIGGGGNNAVDRMITSGVSGVTYAAVNTDMQVLRHSHAEILLQIGQKMTGGFGAGADPGVGEAAAEESVDEIKKTVSEYKMVILTCGMGGGTGTGAIPVIARCCKELGVLVVAVVTLPFSFESGQRMTVALAGLEKLKEYVDTLLVIPNDKLLMLGEKTFYLEDAFLKADSVLLSTISGITNIIFNNGMINIDFNDLHTILAGKGMGHLGIGRADSRGSIMDAMKEAINSPLLDTDITGSESILVNTSGRINLPELREALAYLGEIAGSKVKIIWGTVTDTDSKEDEILITLIATGLKEKPAGEKPFPASPKRAATTGFSPSQKTVTGSISASQNTVAVNNFPSQNTGAAAQTSRTNANAPSGGGEKEIIIPPFLTEWMNRNHKA